MKSGGRKRSLYRSQERNQGHEKTNSSLRLSCSKDLRDEFKRRGREKEREDQNKCRHQKGFWDQVSKPKQKGMESRTAGKTCVHKTWDEEAKVYTNYEVRKLLKRWQEIERRKENRDGSKLSKDKERKWCQSMQRESRLKGKWLNPMTLGDLRQPYHLHDGHERKHRRFLYPKGLKSEDLPNDEVEAVSRFIWKTEKKSPGNTSFRSHWLETRYLHGYLMSLQVKGKGRKRSFYFRRFKY